MSPAVSGPALLLGSHTAYVSLERPRLDPADPGIRLAAEQAGVSPEEFVGPGDVWALVWDQEDGEGDGFELPGMRDIEAEDFAERLLAALATDGPFTVEAGEVLRLDARPAGADAYVFTAHITPPGDSGTQEPLSLRTGPVPTAELEIGRAHV